VINVCPRSPLEPRRLEIKVVRVYSHDSDWPRRSAILASDLLDVAAEELGNLGDRPLLPEQLPGTQTQHARNIGRGGPESESRL
jgi:hypothetical protein